MNANLILAKRVRVQNVNSLRNYEDPEHDIKDQIIRDIWFDLSGSVLCVGNFFFTMGLNIVLKYLLADTNFVPPKFSRCKNFASLQNTKFTRKSLKLDPFSLMLSCIHGVRATIVVLRGISKLVNQQTCALIK
ncbi:hypothetical protein BpHYR1_007246 [Brachionus plicatilis]|uniref:Uncharacterized protein n=1 Tax=Brachionus plicatilis TaxID=10195 RepID=A0A3M7T8I2_BRAPC|nr:hypothetical protein BpHYR1_007246 [Brachionus plicatilis]